jgi:hypothetical protein
LADVRFEAHYGLMQGMARGPKVTIPVLTTPLGEVDNEFVSESPE